MWKDWIGGAVMVFDIAGFKHMWKSDLTGVQSPLTSSSSSVKYITLPQELCEGHPGLPVPNSPCGLCECAATFEEEKEDWLPVFMKKKKKDLNIYKVIGIGACCMEHRHCMDFGQLCLF